VLFSQHCRAIGLGVTDLFFSLAGTPSYAARVVLGRGSGVHGEDVLAHIPRSTAVVDGVSSGPPHSTGAHININCWMHAV